jgi:CNT family concentrative nucleoside transporter
VISFIVKWIGKGIGKLMGTTEVESFVAVANMFLGHTDSPILVSKYLKHLTESEIFVVLVSGMGSISASILGGYQALGIPMEYLLIASAMVPIGSILISKIIYPQTEQIHSITDVKIESKGTNSNVIDALAEGASTGMQIVISIGATLVGFIGAVAFINLFLELFNLNLERIFGYLFAPFGFLLGLTAKEILLEGTLLGNKLILNEFIAFGKLSNHLSELDARAGMICTISLC